MVLVPPQGLPTSAMPLPATYLASPMFGFQPQNSVNGPRLQERATTTLSLPRVSIGQPITKALPPAVPTGIAHCSSSEIPIDPILIAQSQPEQPFRQSIRQDPLSTIPPKQRRSGTLQPPSRQPFLGVDTQVTGFTNPENSEGDSGNHGVEYEFDAVNSSNENQVYHNLHNIHNDADPVKTFADDTGMQYYDAVTDDINDINEDNTNSDPLLGKLL